MATTEICEHTNTPINKCLCTIHDPQGYHFRATRPNMYNLPIVGIFKSEHLSSNCTIVQFISAKNPILISAICSCYKSKLISYWPEIPNLRKDDDE